MGTEFKEKALKNDTGIPDKMKARFEAVSGMAFDDVRVHYHSSQPQNVQALAYTAGNQVYIAPGQERHLPHELGHVVQQKQGIVPATTRVNGVWVNDSPRLERQADEISRLALGGTGNKTDAADGRRGGGRAYGGIQRMSVFEGMKSTGIPQIGRYKTAGWMIQQLGEYLRVDSLRGAKTTAIQKLHDKLVALQHTQDKVSELFIADLRNALQPFETIEDLNLLISRNGAEGLKGMVDTLCRRIGIFLNGLITEGNGQLADELVQDVEARGSYYRIGDVKPYFNFQKAAMHCIAHMAAQSNRRLYLGPHIAITVVGKRIYVAINTTFYHWDWQTPVSSMDVLKARVRQALGQITIEDIKNIMGGKGDHFVIGAGFEGGRGEEVPEDVLNGIYAVVQEMKKYPIMVVDMPGKEQVGKAIHGEMLLMDYFIRESTAPQERSYPGLPATTHDLLAQRDQKLARVVGKTPGMRRIIQFGGTRIDCRKCHEHFQKLNKKIAGNFVVSSRHTTDTYFPGTERGTTPESAGREGTAAVPLTDYFEVVIRDLREIREWIREQKNGRRRTEEIDIPEGMRTFIGRLNESVPELQKTLTDDIAIKQCKAILNLICEITRLYPFEKIIPLEQP